MSLKAQINAIREIKAAGFKVVNSKSVPTDDGACWEATLAFGTQKLVRAFDGGYGGEMEVDLLSTPKLSPELIRSRLTAFFALPATQAMLKASLIEGEGYSLEFKTITQAEFDANKAKILAEEVALTNEHLELAMQALADSYKTIARIKRALKTYICFVQHEEPSLDGVEIRFDPRRWHLFVDTDNRPIRWAESVTVYGHRAYARGVLVYYDEQSAPAKCGDAPSEVVF